MLAKARQAMSMWSIYANLLNKPFLLALVSEYLSNNKQTKHFTNTVYILAGRVVV
jgi:ferric iron reductase protein FhuF